MERYSGVEILEALQVARNYNEYLTNLVLCASPAQALVDFGAGAGLFAGKLRDHGRQVTCIEPDSFQREALAARGFETFATLDSLPNESVELLFSLNVFEHIEDDGQAMRQVYQKLRPGAVLVVYVPAFACLWSSLDVKVCHYRRYTKASLRRLVEQARFVVAELEYADSLGFFAALLFRLLGKGTEALNTSSIGLYDRWLFPVSRVFDRVFHPFFGKNVFAICRK